MTWFLSTRTFKPLAWIFFTTALCLLPNLPVPHTGKDQPTSPSQLFIKTLQSNMSVNYPKGVYMGKTDRKRFPF